jgi:endonuclease-3
VVATERDLKSLFAEEHWNKLHLQIIYFGRRYCPALRHDVTMCPVCSWVTAPGRAAASKRGGAKRSKRTVPPASKMKGKDGKRPATKGKSRSARVGQAS